MLCPAIAFCQYNVVELDGGPIKRNIFGNFHVNNDSTLRAKVFLLNDQFAGLVFTTSNFTFGYEDRKNSISGVITGEVSKEIVALNYQVAVFDVYGDHIINLTAGDLKDYATGVFSDTAKWAVYDDDVLGALTFLVFVSKVRFRDGTVWRYDEKNLAAQLNKLRLTELKKDEKK